MHTFEKELPDAVSVEELKLNNAKTSVDEVLAWVEKTGNMQGRFALFDTFHANSDFYLKVAKPLLSMRAVGSIDVERRIKTLKGSILTKKRNKIKDTKGVVYLRASENLRHLMRAKKMMGKNVSDPL